MNKTAIVKGLETVSIIGFGLAYWRYDLMVATAVLMGLMTLFVVISKALGEPLTKLQLITWIVVLVLGTVSLSFKNEYYIKWKTTVVNGLLAMILLVSQFVGKETITERLIQDKLKTCPPKLLRNLNSAIVIYFLMVAALNIYIAEYFSTTVWMNFKLFGTLCLNILFISGCFYALRDHLKEYMASTQNPSK